jgi:hypothetical protein
MGSNLGLSPSFRKRQSKTPLRIDVLQENKIIDYKITPLNTNGGISATTKHHGSTD